MNDKHYNSNTLLTNVFLLNSFYWSKVYKPLNDTGSIFTNIYNHKAATRIKLYCVICTLEASLCPFLVNPHQRQPVSWLLSPYSRFSCSWTSYEYNHTICILLCLAGFALYCVVRFTYVFACDNSLVFCHYWIVFHWIYMLHACIHSTVQRHVDCSQFWTMVAKSAVSTFVFCFTHPYLSVVC